MVVTVGPFFHIEEGMEAVRFSSCTPQIPQVQRMTAHGVLAFRSLFASRDRGMKRWLVISLVVVALIILVSPGIVGRLAERNMEQGILAAKAQNPALDISTESFERGWFTSAGRHRVVFYNGQLRDANTVGVGDDALTLVIDTRIDHGLLPVSSLGREASSLRPGLASTVSTFHIETASGETSAVPGKFYNEVSLTGASSGQLLLEAGGFDLGTTRLSWEGTDLRIVSDPQDGDLEVEGEVSPFSLSDANGSAYFGTVKIDAEQEGTRYGFSIGELALSVDGARFNSAGSEVSVESIDVMADSAIDDGRLSGMARFELKDAELPSVGTVGVVLDVSLKNVEAASFGAIVVAADNANSGSGQQIDFDAFYPQVENDLKTLARAGAEVRIERFDVSLPQGQLATSLAIDLPELAKDKAFTWPGALLAMTADMSLRIPVPVFELLAVMNPQANTLLATGMLKRDGNDYVMDAKYGKGLVTVNGAPMPLPIPGM